MATFGFIGTGNMGGALARALAKNVEGDSILLANRSAEKAAALAAELGCKAVSSEAIAKKADYIFLGVKPQMMADLLAQLSPILKEREDRFILVTMAAGLTIERIRELAVGDYPVIRIMPNTPADLGQGMILYTLLGASQDDEQTFLQYFSKAGKIDKIPEDKIDAASALSGCGPAFVYAFAEALADGGVECGVPRDKANLYAAQTLLGAAEMLLAFGHPADLKDAVCSPGGTTIAGIHALEDAGFRGAVMDAVTAAYKRTLELKK